MTYNLFIKVTFNHLKLSYIYVINGNRTNSIIIRHDISIPKHVFMYPKSMKRALKLL